MLTTTVTIGLAYLCFANALAGFDCENPANLGCTGSNSGHGCCKECIAQIVEDEKKIENWVSQFKAANPQMSDAQIEKYESADRLDWGHPNLKNCYFCAGQCWNNELDNLHCQVSQANPFGSKRGMTTVSVPHVMRHPDYPKFFPELAAANKTGIEQYEELKTGKRNVEAMCGANEQSKLTLIIPGFGKRFHCDVNCLNKFESSTTRAPYTTHKDQQGNDHGDTFAPATPSDGGVPVSPVTGINGLPATPKPGVVIIGGQTAANQQQTGVACSKESEVCGMAGNTKLFCKCKVCGFKGDTCAGNASSLSFVAAGLALLAAAARFL